ncbi:MAG: CopG family transcriptional regulator [Candidatus Competibacteraceae bacterium]
MATAELHLTEQEQTTLETMAQRTGKTPNELIQDAVKQLLAQFQSEDRLHLLQQARGMWKDRTDLPSVTGLRREWDRRLGLNDGDPTAD